VWLLCWCCKFNIFLYIYIWWVILTLTLHNNDTTPRHNGVGPIVPFHIILENVKFTTPSQQSHNNLSHKGGPHTLGPTLMRGVVVWLLWWCCVWIKSLLYYQPCQLVVELLWEMSVGYIYIYKTMSDGYTLIRVRLSYRTCQKIIGGIYLFLIDQILTKFYQRDVWDLFILLSFVWIGVMGTIYSVDIYVKKDWTN
jgi:hypothetical protein